MQTHLSGDSPSLMMSHFFFLVGVGDDGKHLTQREMYALLSSRQERAENFYCVCSVSFACLQLKIISMPYWDILVFWDSVF